MQLKIKNPASPQRDWNQLNYFFFFLILLKWREPKMQRVTKNLDSITWISQAFNSILSWIFLHILWNKHCLITNHVLIHCQFSWGLPCPPLCSAWHQSCYCLDLCFSLWSKKHIQINIWWYNKIAANHNRVCLTSPPTLCNWTPWPDW